MAQKLKHSKHPKQRYVDKRGAATYAGVSVRTIEQWVHDRRLPASRIGTGQTSPLRFRIDDIDAFMASMRINV